MKILILGGTGAMGKPLVGMLAKEAALDIKVTSRSAHPSAGNVEYVVGNARDNSFLASLLEARYDSIVDFMNYDLDEFADRIPLLLKNTGHYILFSSSRVYAESAIPLTEKSPRLLEVSTDLDFLATNRYALRKARQEDLLRKSGCNNYTVIRPYITYNDERLQLGILEKEQWLYRLLNGKPLVVSKTMLSKKTTLTYGDDVADVISRIIKRNSPTGEVVQIAGNETILWDDLLKNVYIPAVKSVVPSPVVYESDSIKAIEMLYEGGYNTIYDRNYDSSFDSSYIERVVGPIEYTPIREGVGRCIDRFIKGDRRFLHIDPVYEAYQDILTSSVSSREYFDSDEDYRMYKGYRRQSLSEIEGLEDIKELII